MKAKNKINGYAKWVLVVIAILTILYNTVTTHVVAKNDIKHLQKSVEKIEQLLLQHIMEDK